ncbi:MAG TPA: nitrite/sulfite reductase [Solirubrobacteraceae bacterium]|jgi:sulfite reductase beta subunit-like hemoprotein|nr:nitrite/sulfite reductase [Solirubrobacteraceae bacterium]
MEPVSVPAQRGTLEDPEVLQNVPGHVIPILQREYDDFKTESTKFLDGKTEEDEFIKFRLKQGVYGQRQADVQMIRVKLPFGGITPEQMDSFASVVEKYVPLNKGHITTRQNIQMHHIPLPEVELAIRELGETGLSSREGCGNTVRNVTGDPWAGVAADELFDMTPYAGAYVRYFVRHPTTQGMPRKIKTAFDGSPRDRAISGIHDIAYRARVKTIDGREVRGAEMLVGGGTSIMPRVAPALHDFVELDNGDYLKYAEAVFRIFDRQEWLRVNRARARIKVFVDKYGIEELRNQVEEELKGDWVAERDFSIEHRLFLDDERESAPSAPASYGSPNGDLSEFERFRAANVAEQKQEGFVTVEVKITRGDLTPDQFRGLAQVMRDYAGGYARTTVQQNFVLRWVREECVYDLWQALLKLDLGEPGSREIDDVVSCPGTDSCKLGITSSMGLNQAVQERIESLNITDELTRKLNVKISGCPNGCGQHHVASIGFTGASIKVGDHTIPAYIPHVGGVFEGGAVEFGTRLKLRLPSKRVPDAIERWIGQYEANREQGEEWNAYLSRVGTAELESAVKDLSMPVDFGLETMNTFIDWNRDVPFEVIRGEGECAV